MSNKRTFPVTLDDARLSLLLADVIQLLDDERSRDATFIAMQKAFPNINRLVHQAKIGNLVQWSTGWNNKQQVIFFGGMQTLSDANNLIWSSLNPLFIRNEFGASNAYIENVNSFATLTGNLWPDEPTSYFLCGHSQGGATALVFAAELRAEGFDGPITVVTFGAPKPGNQRLADLIKDCHVIQWADTHDWVCALPPSISPIGWSYKIYQLLRKNPLGLLTASHDSYVTPDGVVPLDEGGRSYPDEAPQFLDGIADLVTRIVEGQEGYAIVQPHLAVEYKRRIRNYIFWLELKAASVSNQLQTSMVGGCGSSSLSSTVGDASSYAPAFEGINNSSTIGASRMIIPSDFRPKIQRIPSVGYAVYLDGQNLIEFSTRARAVSFARKLMGVIKALAKANSFTISDFTDVILGYITDASGTLGTANGFNPVLPGS